MIGMNPPFHYHCHHLHFHYRRCCCCCCYCCCWWWWQWWFWRCFSPVCCAASPKSVEGICLFAIQCWMQNKSDINGGSAWSDETMMMRKKMMILVKMMILKIFSPVCSAASLESDESWGWSSSQFNTGEIVMIILVMNNIMLQIDHNTY